MIPAIKHAAERCLFTKQYVAVAYGEMVIVLFVSSHGKAVALDR